jgi:hypothetical protein
VKLRLTGGVDELAMRRSTFICRLTRAVPAAEAGRPFWVGKAVGGSLGDVGFGPGSQPFCAFLRANCAVEILEQRAFSADCAGFLNSPGSGRGCASAVIALSIWVSCTCA